MSTIPSFPDQEAFRHPLAPDGRESLAHVMVFPEHGFAGFLYPSVRGDGLGKQRVLFFGPAFDGVVEEATETHIAPSMNFDDWQVGGLRMAVHEPHKRVDLGWDGPRAQFEGSFEARHPVYAFSSGKRGVPSYFGDNRTEQHGRLTGRLTVEGKSFDLDGYMIRDHSWGSRVWGLNQHHKWIHATTADASVHFFEMQSFGRVLIYGYVFKDGQMSHLEAIDYHYDFDDDLMQRDFCATIRDSLGRVTTLTTQAFAPFRYDLDPSIYLNYTAVTVEVDGVAGSGWIEFCWNRDYHDYARPHSARFGAVERARD